MNLIYVLLGVVFIVLLAILIGEGLQHIYTKYQKYQLAAKKRKKYEMARRKRKSPLNDITNRLYF